MIQYVSTSVKKYGYSSVEIENAEGFVCGER